MNSISIEKIQAVKFFHLDQRKDQQLVKGFFTFSSMTIVFQILIELINVVQMDEGTKVQVDDLGRKNFSFIGLGNLTDFLVMPQPEVGLGKEGFVFLGCYLRIVRSHFKGRTYLFRWPAPKAMKAIHAKVRALTDRRRRAGMKDIRDVIQDLNPVLRGWGNYFRTGNASDKFRVVDQYVTCRLQALLRKRGGQRRAKSGGRPFNPWEWPHQRFVDDHGLHKLLGTIRYPGKAYAT